MPRLLLLCLLASAGAASPALADGEVDRLITAHDRSRLQRYETTRREASAEARAGGNPADIAIVEAALGGERASFEGFDMTGAWRCRTIKLGGLLPLVVYDWFRCRVDDDGSGWRLEKISGSQRTTGRFFTDSESRLIYLGSFYIAGEPTPPYGSRKDSDQVGYAYRNGSSRFWIEFPQPAFESKLDVLELRR